VASAPDTDPVIRVECLTQFDPPYILVVVAGAPLIYAPKPVYDMARASLNLPDYVCEGRTVGD